MTKKKCYIENIFTTNTTDNFKLKLITTLKIKSEKTPF